MSWEVLVLFCFSTNWENFSLVLCFILCIIVRQIKRLIINFGFVDFGFVV
jgi:hypothetical protein